MTVLNSLTVNMILESGTYKDNVKTTRQVSNQEFDSMAQGAESSGKRVRNSLRTTEQEMMKRSKRIREVVRGFGYQGQDIAIQLAMGTKASTVLSQQGSQLLSMFGPGGAIAGAALSIGTLAYQFISAKTEAGDLDAILKDLDKTFDTAKDGAMLFSDEIAKLAKQDKELARTKLSLMFTEAGLAATKAREQIKDAVSGIETDFKKSRGWLDFGEASAVGVGPDPWVQRKQVIVELGEQYGIAEEDAKKFADAVDLVKKNGSDESIDALSNTVSDIATRTPTASYEFKKLAYEIANGGFTAKTAAEQQKLLGDALQDLDGTLKENTKTADTNRTKIAALVKSWQDKAASVGMTAVEAAKYNAITANGIDIESEQGKALSESITKYFAEKEAIEAANKAKQERERLLKKEINRGKSVFERLTQPKGSQAKYQADLDAMGEYFKSQYDLKDEDLKNHQLYLEAKEKLDEEYALKREQIMLKQNSSLVSSMQTTTGLIADAFDDQSAVGKAAFLTSKALAASQAIIAGYSQANSIRSIPSVSWGGVMSKEAAAKMSVGMGYTNAGLIMGTALAGMAHSGIDDVPKEGTWLLDKGERVVDSRTNQDLKKYLAAGGGGGGGNVTVQIMGNVYGDNETRRVIDAAAAKARKELAMDFKSNGPLYKMARA